MARSRTRAATLLVTIVAVGAYLYFLGQSGPASKYAQRLVILGFDGMDPDLVRQWMAEGKLPNLKRVVQQGGLYPLATTHSPESPTAWASFATGVNPGKHNIFDF